MRSLIIGDKGKTVGAPRELLIALPSDHTDQYRIHQIVWDYVDRSSPGIRGTEFLYRIDGGMIRVRSTRFSSHRTSVSMLSESRPVYVDLAALKGARHDEEIPVSELSDWCAEKFNQAGLAVTEIEIFAHEVRTGIKIIDGQSLSISLPVARVRAMVKIVDHDAANLAWNAGVGRAKRFGLGMLSH